MNITIDDVLIMIYSCIFSTPEYNIKVKRNKYLLSQKEAMDFSSAWKNSDQILVVEDDEFHVHRCMLSLWSPVFDRMFHSHFKEKTSERIELKMKKSCEVREMLKVMYDRTKQITGNLSYIEITILLKQLI